MLELRPNCEHCNRALPPQSLDARICTFECTFCAECVDNILKNICPNCGGGFMPRPIRTKAMLAKYPSSTQAVFKPVDLGAHAKRIAQFANISPEDR